MVLSDESISEQEIKKSRFITYLSRVQTVQEAHDFFLKIRKLHPNCTHVCTAFKAGNLSGSNDDGEPSGTAGKPMLNVLLNCEADQIAAAVVRYFGGTLLGKGGLVRAYSSSVSQALDEAKNEGLFVELVDMNCYQIRFDYSLTGKVDHFLSSHEAMILNRDYGEKATLDIACSFNPTSSLMALGSGQIEIYNTGTMQVKSACANGSE
ncbi:IMPACT family protein [Ileibacterium valens]|uniref:IMPACT family protein n=1 Tax=Ileibacterium valens TaxID=1862668 RepID=UPI002353B00E|nr:YigZ family protein [Ileibacterium valens]